jgi:addiction module HigA family antidote
VRQTRHHPGAYLQELLIWHRVSAEELAREIEVPSRAIVELAAARRPVDRDLSRGLAAYFGNSAGFWLDLQARFDRRTGA